MYPHNYPKTAGRALQGVPFIPNLFYENPSNQYVCPLSI